MRAELLCEWKRSIPALVCCGESSTLLADGLSEHGGSYSDLAEGEGLVLVAR